MSSNDSEIKEEIIDKEDLVINSNLNEIPQFFEAEEKYNVKDEESVCNLIFVSKTDVDLDYLYIDENINDTGKTFSCKVCDQTYTTMSNLKKHISTVHEGIRYCCPFCKKEFTQKCELNIHVRDRCKATFAHKQGLNGHLISYPEGKKQFQCFSCNKLFLHLQSLSVHNISCHLKTGNVSKKYIVCNICDETYMSMRNLKSHISSIHESIEFYCPLCKEEFTQKYSLDHHVRRFHHEVKPFSCKICDKSFSEQYSIKRHIAAVHEGKKPYQCSICNTKFTENGSLKRHISVVHERKKP